MKASYINKFPAALLRLAVAAACSVGIWWSYTIARADSLFRQDTPENLRAAIALVPDQPKYYARLALLEPNHAETMLDKALSISRYNSQAAIDLGLLREEREDYDGAERLFQAAFEVDKTYLTRWTLANFYFRRENLPQFWRWARKAAEMPSNNIRPLFQLCWRAEPDSSVIERQVLTGDPVEARQFLSFLLDKNELSAVAAFAPQLIARGKVDTDQPALFSLTNRLVEENYAQETVSVWEALAKQGWIVRDPAIPYNGSFARQLLPVKLDWQLSSIDGLLLSPGPTGLMVEFSGKQPEDCVIAEQVLPLSRGRHEFTYSYRTAGIAPETGLRWTVSAAKPDAEIGRSRDLSSPEERQESFQFETSEPLSLVRVRLQYRRAVGTTRIAGNLVVAATKCEVSHKS